MKKTTAVLAALALAFAGTLPSFAADQKIAEKPTETAPVAAPAPDKVYLPTELDALRPLIGKAVTIEGKLQRLGANKGQSIRYLNFTANYRDSVALVFFVEKGGDAFKKEKLTEWLGKKVRVTGKVSEFNGNLQIEIEKPEQLQEIPEAAPTAEPAKTP